MLKQGQASWRGDCGGILSQFYQPKGHGARLKMSPGTGFRPLGSANAEKKFKKSVGFFFELVNFVLAIKQET